MPQINPRAILLDLDGTLANSLAVMRLSYERFLRRFNVKSSEPEFDSLMGPPLAEVVLRLKSLHGLVGDHEKLLADYCSLIDKEYSKVCPCVGAHELLDSAKTHQCVVGVVTSNTRLRTSSWLKQVGMEELVSFIVASDDVVNGKPHPEPYLLATKYTRCPSSQIVAIEDSPQGVSSAVEAGLITFAVGKRTSIKPWPTSARVKNSLDEVAASLW